jgi:hypothetical protein
VGIQIDHVKVTGSIEAEDIETDHVIVMTGYLFDGHVDLAGLTSKNNVSFNGSWFGKWLDIDGSDIKGDLLMGYKATFHGVNLSSAIVHGNIDLGTSSFYDSVDLSSAEVDGQLILKGEKDGQMIKSPEDTLAKWRTPKAMLNLKNAHVGKIPRLDDPWPPAVNLLGLKYEEIVYDSQPSQPPTKRARIGSPHRSSPYRINALRLADSAPLVNLPIHPSRDML